VYFTSRFLLRRNDKEAMLKIVKEAKIYSPLSTLLIKARSLSILTLKWQNENLKKEKRL
jgi:hypothetical protein